MRGRKLTAILLATTITGTSLACGEILAPTSSKIAGTTAEAAQAEQTTQMPDVTDEQLATQRLNAWYSQALDSIENEDYQQALLCLNACLTSCTREGNATLYADIYMKKGYCNLSQGKYQEAIQDLDEALDTDPELSNAILLKASAYSEMQEYPSAIEQLEAYTEKTGDKSVYESLAALYEATGDSEKAFADYQIFAENSTTSPEEAASLCGVYQMQRGNYETAIEWFDKALPANVVAGEAAEALTETDSEGIEMLTETGTEVVADTFAENATEAGETVAEAVTESAEDTRDEVKAPDAYYYRGVCHMTLLHYEEAISDFTACVDGSIRLDDSRINRGICRLLSSDGQKALEDFDACVEAESHADEARYYRSFVYLAAGENEKALEDLTTCIDNGYDLSASYLQRAQVYQAMGNEEAYQSDLEASKNVNTETVQTEAATE